MKKPETIKQLQGLTRKDLLVQLQAEEETYFRLRFAHKVSALENPAQLRIARRQIARIKTFIQQQDARTQS